MPNQYFIICECAETGINSLWYPGVWYVKYAVRVGYGEKIMCMN